MKRFTLLAACTLVLLGGCATGNQAGQQAAAENTYTPVGTIIPRKAPSRADNVTIVDKQALENDRTMGNGTLSPPSTR